jgi:hypothetical protein
MTGHVERMLSSYSERGIEAINRNRTWLKERGISYDTLHLEGIAFGQQGIGEQIRRGEVALVYALEMLEAADTAFCRARTLAE